MTAESDTTGQSTGDPSTLDLTELRARRDAAVATESGLSYLRRLVQGPLDLVRAELEHRAAGEQRDLATMVEQLPDVLTETGRGAAGGRLPRSLDPTSLDSGLQSELDRLTNGGAKIADLPGQSNDELVALAHDLDSLERRISVRRQSSHRVIDALNGELAERYRSGAATVEGALSSRPE